MSHESARQLLQEIANCPEAQVCRAGKDDHPCSAIVGVQRETRPDMFQRPEPWSGFLDTAPLLFISSNPSLSEDENYPTTSWTADMAPPGSSSRRCPESGEFFDSSHPHDQAGNPRAATTERHYRSADGGGVCRTSQQPTSRSRGG